MAMVNTTIEKINTEFIAIQSLVSGYSPEVTENELLIQLDFIGLDSVEILTKLSNLTYFEVYIDGESPSLVSEKLRTPALEFTLDDLKRLKCRARYSKDIQKDYVKNLDYYFFIPDKALEFIISSPFNIDDKKKVIGIYNTPSFSTPTFSFIDILNETDYEVDKLIEVEDREKINRLLVNTDQKFNLYNNVYSYMCEPSNSENGFQESIIREFYKAFFRLISYKENHEEYDIRGKKKIIIKLDEDFKIDNFAEFISLTDFLFSDDKFLEKYIIVKNVFTRYVYDKESFSSLDLKIPEINKTTKYYFEKYIQEDLEDFFKNRDTIFKEAINISKSINEQNDKINTYINASLITFLILGITYIFRGVLNSHFTELVIGDFSLFVFSLAFYNYISKSSAERYNTTQKQFNLFLDSMGIILTEEKDELLQTYLKDPYNDLQISLSRIKYLLILANVALLTVTVTSIIYYFNS